MKIPNPCEVKGCNNLSTKGPFCQMHLEKPVAAAFQFSEKVKVNPTIFKKKAQVKTDYQTQNAIINTLMLSSPLNLKKSKSCRKSTIRLLEDSKTHNSGIESRLILERKLTKKSWNFPLSV